MWLWCPYCIWTTQPLFMSTDDLWSEPSEPMVSWKESGEPHIKCSYPFSCLFGGESSSKTLGNYLGEECHYIGRGTGIGGLSTRVHPRQQRKKHCTVTTHPGPDRQKELPLEMVFLAWANSFSSTAEPHLGSGLTLCLAVGCESLAQSWWWALAQGPSELGFGLYRGASCVRFLKYARLKTCCF